ncbi:hypothetical protein CGCFRS4_v009358 [Colletotrichum fructicola]|nr:hypothetical protein CGCFRS4_v009358 [Colletotrichum fructicola]KAF4935314.1 hypothetical protein CGCF245_v007804 [Colletotrichum fructicola]
MSGPVEYNQMPREPAPAMIVEPNHSEQPVSSAVTHDFRSLDSNEQLFAPP